MPLRRALPLLAACAACLAAAGSAAAGAGACRTVVAPPEEGIYHAAFPYDEAGGGGEDAITTTLVEGFEERAGRRIAWAYFSNLWLGGEIRFPREQVAAVAATGAVAFVRLQPAPSSSGRSRPRTGSSPWTPCWRAASTRGSAAGRETRATPAWRSCSSSAPR